MINKLFKHHWPIIMALIIITITLSFYFWIFHKDFSYTNGDWGTFGDFFGGVMNPILGFINLLLLTKTLASQKEFHEENKNFLATSETQQTKNIKIQEVSARIVAIGHLLDITSQQIKHLSEHSHLLKDAETKLLNILNENYKTHLEELDQAYNDLKILK